MKNRIGDGKMSACGGNGYGGGGGGRISVDVFSRHDDPRIFVHGESFQPLVNFSVVSVTKLWSMLQTLIILMPTTTTTYTKAHIYICLWMCVC